MAALQKLTLSRSIKTSGFTLMEVMIVVVIVGVLLAVALPGYQSSLQKGRRSDAKGALKDVANRQEQFMLDRNTYTTDMSDLGYGVDPMVSGEQHYTVDATACGGGNITRCYRLTATPRPGSAQDDDEQCYLFILDSSGAESAQKKDGNPATANCW